MDALTTAARGWLEDDPDDHTRGELAGILAAASAGDTEALADLADRFSGTLEFGTAGLRGRMGAGPNRMNRAVVIRAAAGLARYLTDTVGPGAVVAIGYDARHGSAQFARDTAGVMTAAGHHARLLPRRLPTPVLAYATLALNADAGVMVTASHNPPQDNGYKVYLGGRVVTDEGRGAQIVPPHDADIAARIAAVGPVAAVPRTEGGWEIIGESVIDDYIAAAAAVAGHAPDERRATTRIVLTPLHGVGGDTGRRVLASAGFDDIHLVEAQEQPDPDFPTVAFPNPEEHGAIDLALDLAREIGADVVIANDPDADRCAVATVVDGRWQMLHGDVVGSLLGELIASRISDTPGAVLANSIVSSQQLSAIAAAHGLRYVATLTGFKWIGRVPSLAFGYEEALGYCVAPHVVRDKDGLSAAVLIASLVADLGASGRTLADAIDDLARTYGVYLTRQVAARFANTADIAATMRRLLDAPPTRLGGSPVTSFDTLDEGYAGLPPTPGLHLATEAGARVIIRPSGTEPKVKAYLEVVAPCDGDVGVARAKASDAMDLLERAVRGALHIA